MEYNTLPYLQVYCKGAPEKIADLCDPSTLPLDFRSTLHHYTSRGMRVLGFGAKTLGEVSAVACDKMPRHRAEEKLKFLGLLVTSNKVKKDTVEVIDVLRKADCRCLMATGDSAMTAVAVARECGIIDR